MPQEFKASAYPSSLEDLASRFGRTLTPDALAFADFAAAVQAGRVEQNFSKRRGVTRSTAIWSCAAFDDRIGEIMSGAGFDMAVFGRKIGAVSPSTPEAEGQSRHLIEPEFADALASAWVLDGDAHPRVAVPDLAHAVLTQATGRVQSRLIDAHGNVGAAAAALSAILGIDRDLGTPPSTDVEAPDSVYPGIPRPMRDVTPGQFGVALDPQTSEPPPYFPRSVDQELADALRSRPRAVVVTAPVTSGATRTVYEALRQTSPDRMVLLADELASNPDVIDPEQLMMSRADVVWIRDLRRLVEASPQLGSWFSERHGDVLATIVAVVRPEDEDLVVRLGLADGARRLSMEAVLTDTERGAAYQTFGRELTRIDEVVRASRTERTVQAAYLADSHLASRLTTANDVLDIGRDVQMLASLIASSRILPPLSIGLFGPWGSGKSFLMHQIKLSALELAARSEELPPGQASAYCPRLVTVDFNAWQYVHGVDLWASLVSRVFEEIREKLADNDAYQSLWKEIRELSNDVVQAQQEFDEAEAELHSRATTSESKSVEEVTKDDPHLKASAATLKSTIDLDPAKTELKKLRTEVQELGTVVGKFTRGWRGASGRRRIGVIFLLIVALLSLGAVAFLGMNPGQDLASVLASAVSVLTAVNAVIKPARLALGAGVEILDADRRRYEDVRRRHHDAAEALAAARSQGPAALYGYVSDRSIAADYRQHLGVGPMIREDLARLASLAGGGENGPTIIDRIVIFIDDLDRCPAKEVVRVLEAVNLLFGHPLFVVVVAVDSRWLLKSLSSEFRDIFSDEDVAAPTPQNYLEKIIQIPFWLQSVRRTGFGRLVTALVGEVDDQGATTSTAPPAMSLPSQDRTAAAGDVPLQPESEPAPLSYQGPDPAPSAPRGVATGGSTDPVESEVDVDLNPAALRLTPGERDYLLGFFDLVTTPRATKRFLNTYQLLRSGIRDVEGYVVSEEYRPVLLLLALLTGTALVDQTMVEDLRGMREDNFAEFLMARASDNTNRRQWKAVEEGCADLPLDLLTPAVIEKWCARVARYSFHPVGR